MLASANEALELAVYDIPKAVDPQCSFIRGRNGWVVTASGGVDINGFDIVSKQVVSPEIAETKGAALASTAADRWWWNK